MHRCDLLLAYCQHHRIFEVDGSCELFANKAIGRKLANEGVGLVLAHLVKKGQGEWCDVKLKGKCHVYWNTPAQWADIVRCVEINCSSCPLWQVRSFKGCRIYICAVLPNQHTHEGFCI